MESSLQPLQHRRAFTAKAGDLLLFSGANWPSRLICLATFGPYSHVGIIGPDGLLYESDDGVRAIDPQAKIDSYQGSVWLASLTRPLYGHEVERLQQHLVGHLGKPYDLAGAIRANKFTAFLSSLLRTPDDSAFLCSELCASALNEIGLCPNSNAERWSPNSLFRFLRLRGLVRKPLRIK